MDLTRYPHKPIELENFQTDTKTEPRMDGQTDIRKVFVLLLLLARTGQDWIGMSGLDKASLTGLIGQCQSGLIKGINHGYSAIANMRPEICDVS